MRQGRKRGAKFKIGLRPRVRACSTYGSLKRKRASSTRFSYTYVPVVFNVVRGHGRVGHPVVDDSVDAHRYRVSRQDLERKLRKIKWSGRLATKGRRSSA